MATAVDERAMGRISPRAYINGHVSPRSSRVLAKAQILDAIARSTDDGCTLDLSNKNLVDVGEQGAEELAQIGRGGDLSDECRISRIALVGNNLSSLPMPFAQLSRLRYLTLRSNSFSVFPEVLTNMPSLEILDLSRNRVRGFPTNPGTLVNLRVLSISRNRIRKLPKYLSKFKNLTVFKADHNPIEWPPQYVMEPDEDLEDTDVMRRWIGYVQTWIRGNDYIDDKPSHQFIRSSTFSETAHSRSVSVDSEASSYSTTSHLKSPEDQKPVTLAAVETENIFPTVADGISRSPDSYLPTLEDSLPCVNVEATRSAFSTHGRNRSYAQESKGPSHVPRLAMQKSLPDLRASPSSRTKARVPVIESKKDTADQSTLQIDASSVSEGSSQSHLPNASRRDESHEPDSSMSKERAPSLDFERNSYFRRFSMLPTSTISRTTPSALLSFVDSIRGILFALSQIYQCLQHYTVYTIDERLSSVLLKVLKPASSYLLQLINALDQFDAQSKQGCPPPFVCRKVVEGCRDNVSIFGKAVRVLTLQLKVLTSRDDVRYLRQMLLVLYGAMAEISNSWLGMAPLIGTIEAILRNEPYQHSIDQRVQAATPMKTLKPAFNSQTSSSRSHIAPIAEQLEPPLPSAPPSLSYPVLPLVRTQSAQAITQTPAAKPMSRSTVSGGRSRTMRRQAGSFSTKDVEIGRSLPSNNNASPLLGGVATGSGTPTPRPPAQKSPSQLSALPGSHGPTTPSLTSSHVPFPVHSRQGSANNSASTLAAPQLSITSPSRPMQDGSTSSSSKVVDKEVIDAMSSAVRAAPAVWSMLAEMSSEISGAPVDLRDSLAKAQDLTQRLDGSIRSIQEGQSSPDRKALRGDAHLFVKTVIALSKIVKDYGTSHRLSAQLRRDIAKLTNATQEFVMLLHVSSFAPSTPRPSSPNTATSLSGAQSSALLGVAPDEKIGIMNGLPPPTRARSRSAQPPISSRTFPTPILGAVPHSALPHQGFKLPPTPRTTFRPNGGSQQFP